MKLLHPKNATAESPSKHRRARKKRSELRHKAKKFWVEESKFHRVLKNHHSYRRRSKAEPFSMVKWYCKCGQTNSPEQVYYCRKCKQHWSRAQVARKSQSSQGKSGLPDTKHSSNASCTWPSLQLPLQTSQSSQPLLHTGAIPTHASSSQQPSVPEQSALLGKLKTALAEANYVVPEPIMTILNQASAKSMQSQLHAEANKLGKLEKKVRRLEEAIAKSKTAWTTYVQQVQQKLTQDAATCQQVIASAQMELVQAKQELSIQSQQTQMLISQLVQTQTQAPCPPAVTPMEVEPPTYSPWVASPSPCPNGTDLGPLTLVSMLTQSLAEHGPMTAMPDMLARPAEQDALAKAAAQHANNIDILQPWEHERTSHAPAPNPSGGQDWMRTGAPTAITPSPVTPPGVWDEPTFTSTTAVAMQAVGDQNKAFSAATKPNIAAPWDTPTLAPLASVPMAEQAAADNAYTAGQGSTTEQLMQQLQALQQQQFFCEQQLHAFTATAQPQIGTQPTNQQRTATPSSAQMPRETFSIASSPEKASNDPPTPSNHQGRNPKIPKSNMGNIAEQPCQMHVAGMATPPHSEVASCTPSPVPTEVATGVDDMAEDGSMQRLE